MTVTMRLLALLLSQLATKTRSFSFVGMDRTLSHLRKPSVKYPALSASTPSSDTVFQAIQRNKNASTDTVETRFLVYNHATSSTSEAEYQKGFALISLITLFNASLAPVWHIAFAGNGPPPLLLNAAVSCVALVGLLGFGPLLDSTLSSTSNLAQATDQKWSGESFRGGIQLGFWKCLGTTCHIYGVALTTANHSAFLLQLTTLIVPIFQGIMGERIPRKVQLAVVLALAGIYTFTQDPTGSDEAMQAAKNVDLGDLLCIGAAFFYSIYDIQTFSLGRSIPRKELVTIKVGFQCLMSCLLCATIIPDESLEFFGSGPEWKILLPAILWSGLIVNALATFLQVGGIQATGPTRAQTIFASQPLWAAIMNFTFLGETIGLAGLGGGAAFLGALVLAATAEAPTSNGGSDKVA